MPSSDFRSSRSYVALNSEFCGCRLHCASGSITSIIRGPIGRQQQPEDETTPNHNLLNVKHWKSGGGKCSKQCSGDSRAVRPSDRH